MNCTTRWPIRVHWGLVLLRLVVSLLPLISLSIHGENLGQVRTMCLVHLRSESECDTLPDAHQPKPRYARAKVLGPEYRKLLLRVRLFLPFNRRSYFGTGHRCKFYPWHFNTALLELCYTPFGTCVNLTFIHKVSLAYWRDHGTQTLFV